MTITGLVVPMTCAKCGGDLLYLRRIEEGCVPGTVERAGVECCVCGVAFTCTVTLRALQPSARGWRPQYDYDEAV